MVKNHLKRIAAPKHWKIKRKSNKFITRPNPGKKLKSSVSLNMALKEMLKISKTNKETKQILNSKNIFVDGKRRKDVKFPIGILEVLSIKETKEYYRLSISEKGNLIFISVKEEESNLVPLKIKNKTLIKKNKVQINLSNSMNILVDKDKYKTNDSIVFDFDKKKIKEHYPLAEKVKVIVVSGRNIGKKGEVESIEGKKVKIKSNGLSFETRIKQIFVVGNEKSTITV